MRRELQERCDLFIENRKIIRAEFSWESIYIYPLCAAQFACKGLEADAGLMRSNYQMLKQKTGIFSNFRGTARMALISMLSLSPNPEEKLEQMFDLYNRLKEVFWASEYLTITSAVIADLADPAQYDSIVKRTRVIYNKMKEAHPFLTSGEDSPFAALLALSGLEDDKIMTEMEQCYQILKPEFFSSNAVQSLSHILALGEDSAEQKCHRTMELFNNLKSRGCKYGTNFELATLGVLALMKTDIAALTEDIVAVNEFLKPQKGFGSVVGIGTKQRLMYAAMLTMCDYFPPVQTMQTAALNGVISLVIAQQAAICASIAATSAAAAASSSNS